MRYLHRLIWAALIAVVTASPALSQTTGGMSSSVGGSSLGGSAGGATGSTGGSSSSTALSSLSSTPTITAPANTGGATSNALSTSNFLAPYYANPYYQGVLTNSQSNNNNPGGFGTALFNGTTGGSTGGGAIGFAGTTGSTGATGRTGTTTGGGRAGTSSSSSSTAIIIPLQVQISFRAESQINMRDVPVVVPSQLQSEINGMIRRSKDVTYPADVQVTVEGKTATLRGTVKDDEEKKLIANMVAMTPGIGPVKNELTTLNKKP
jgi:hypothetical protein